MCLADDVRHLCPYRRRTTHWSVVEMNANLQSKIIILPLLIPHYLLNKRKWGQLLKEVISNRSHMMEGEWMKCKERANIAFG